MYFIDTQYSYTYEIKKSKFVAHIAPYKDFTQLLIQLKQKHPKGRHFVYAYRYKNEFNQIVENSSDDGEPKSTSGKPSLAVLAGANIINCCVIIVRYFGGIKLGTGGLVRAYGTSVKEVLNISNIKEYVELIDKQIIVQYSRFSKLEYLADKHNIIIEDKFFNEKIMCTLQGSNENFKLFATKLERDMILEDLNNE